MDNIGLKDIINLAIKGYKVSDIKELISIAKELPTGGEAQASTIEISDPEEKPETENTQEDAEAEEPASDSEALQKKIEALEAKIKELQADNINKDIAGKQKTGEEQFSDFVKSFLEGGKTNE